MPDLRISQLPTGGLAQATDEIVVARTGGNNRITAADIAAAATRVGTLTSLAVSGNGVVQTINGSASAFTDYRIGGVSQARVGTQNFATGDLSLLTLTSAPVVFGTNNTERMRLDASGNLGLGVTPSPWSGGRAIEVGVLGNGLWGFGANELYQLSNAYFNAGFKYAAAGTATQYLQYNGTHQWSTAASGTAGNAITFTQAMTLDASGNLGVGTASPDGRFHSHAFSAGSVTASVNANLGVFEDGLSNGISILVPDGSLCNIFFGSPSNNRGAEIVWGFNANQLQIGTRNAGGDVSLYSGNFTERARVKSAGQFRFVPLAAAPTANVEDGDVYYDSGTNKLRVRAGGAWTDLH